MAPRARVFTAGVHAGAGSPQNGLEIEETQILHGYTQIVSQQGGTRNIFGVEGAFDPPTNLLDRVVELCSPHPLIKNQEDGLIWGFPTDITHIIYAVCEH